MNTYNEAQIVNMKSEIEGQYDVILSVEDGAYIVKYGAEIKFTNSFYDALDFYDGCVKHQINCTGIL